MPDLRSFSRRIVLRGQKIQDNADKLTRKVALVVDQAVVSETPVDTGRARSNWIVALDEPADSTISAYAPGKGGSTGSSNIQAALDQGRKAIAGYKTGKEIHICNNLPYIQRLNDGYSHQAGKHYVERATVEAAQAVQSFKLVE
jgi:hypothetical protein